MMWANRNGYFYVLDRATGKFLLGKPFVKVNWASGLDANGRPDRRRQQPPGMPTYPGNQGGTNWFPPSFSPRTGLFYFGAWENYGSIYRREAGDLPAGPEFLRRRPRGRDAGARRAGVGIGRRARSTTGPTQWATARSSRWIRRPASRNGSSSSTTSPRRAS